ncbi:hypothetical protein CASFOL_028530 [Castilleja foliolosa]|uniref:SHSP domain-containing protein n=1 Tax=Castilleja foliolosa TaxID=1961234 RepID=A0ABD3CEN4_9LAMI
MSSVFPLRSLGLSESGTCMDWKETPEAHIFEFDLPGLAKQEVKLQVHDDRVLHVSANIKEEEDEKLHNNYNYKWHCKERLRIGSFYREFRLPENALVDEIRASMSDGLLVVTVPKDRNKKKRHGIKKRAVVIEGEGDHDHDRLGSSNKGLGRFVCCKA